MQHTQTVTAPVPIGELLEAWLAVQRGDFRRPAPGRDVWVPVKGEVPVVTIGVVGSAGTSTVALGLAAAAGGARVIECGPGACSGLAGAATAELGSVADGWVAGRRDELRILRRGDQVPAPEVVPPPPVGETGVTVVDCWWEVRQSLHAAGWLGDLLRVCPRVVLVTPASIPGFRRVEICLGLVGPARCWVAVTSASKRRRDASLGRWAGPLTAQVRDQGRLVWFPFVPQLAVSGITSEPLPKALHGAAADLLKGLLS
ncbi:MAG: hypothetical protein QM619_13075 [Micropruina sp.]|uniref:hypothetical protein n=1 Tax=Micropruina sp. TaxID=2737536 RepID=UPI0039E63883